MNPVENLTQDNNTPHQSGGRVQARGLRPASPDQRLAFRSQIPIRTPLNPQGSYLHARSQDIQTHRMIDAYMRSVLLPQHPGGKPDSAASAERLACTLAARETLVKNMDIAFNVCGKRLQADLGHISMVCSALARQEQQEKEKWKSLCAKVMKERDDARSTLEAMGKGRLVPRSSVLKREREACTSDHPRPIRPLPASRSPSPSSSAYSRYSSTPPPYSAESNDQRTSSRRASAPSLTTTFHLSSSPPREKGAEGPPLKRQRSYDLSRAENLPSGSSPLPERSSPSSPLQPVHNKPTGAPALPDDFLHVDLMYVRENETFVCRACILNSSKAHPASRVEPKSFPTTVSWDDLREHCRTHPDACRDVLRLHPAEIFELRRRQVSMF